MSVILTGLAQKLYQNKLLSEAVLIKALQEAHSTQISFIHYLYQQKLVHPTSLAKIIAQEYELPLFDSNNIDVTQLPLQLLPEKFIRQQQTLPLHKKDNFLLIAISDPTQLTALNEIKFHTGLTAKCYIAEQQQLNKIIEQVLNSNEIKHLHHLSINDAISIEPDQTSNDHSEDAPIVRYIHKIICEAIDKKASDIHFEPQEKHYQIRLRIDGILYVTTTTAASLANRITARLKIIAQLDIAERRVPQDGRFKLNLPNSTNIDCRVSTCPTLYGEKIVVRILNTHTELLNIENLGLNEQQKNIFYTTISRPQGLILVTGPTGCGKTSTLYNTLHLLNKPEVNILTIEDPIEIHLTGVNQVNIHPKAGLTFASALRAFLRQDPDVIMVGEMRDTETAEIGIKAAQTGHLVLSTLHTNNALESITRLLNMGISHYNLISSIHLIIAQRLIRRLCHYCKQPENLPAEILLQEGFHVDEIADLTLFHAHGCEHCQQGYRDRIGVFELLVLDPTIQQLILNHCHPNDIAQQACSNGMQTLKESALDKVRQGITSLAEINRVLV